MKDLRRNNIDSHGCCSGESEQDFTPINNCDSKGCKPINVTPDLDAAVTIPIIGYKIFDCITLEDKQFRFDPNVKFYIEDGCYCYGDSICVEKVRVDYDFIGLTEDTIKGKLDAQSINFYASKDSVYEDETCDGEEVYLYDEFTATVKEKYRPTDSCSSQTEEGVKVTIFHRDLEFYVLNLKITVTGKIGCKNFVASTTPYSGSLSGICDSDDWTPKFRTTDLYGKVCVPKGAKKVSIEEEFKALLCVDCVSTSDTYVCVDDGKSSFEASVEYCLSIKSAISTIIKEKMLVVTTPGITICHDGNLDGCKCLECPTKVRSVANLSDEYIPTYEEYTTIEDNDDSI